MNDERSPLNVNVFGTGVSREALEDCTAEVDGRELRGVARRSPYDLAVQIVHPYVHLAAAVHLMPQARPYRTFEGAYGQQRMREMLAELYRLGRYLDDHVETLRARYLRDVTGHRVGATADWEDVFDEARSRLRRQLRNGTLTSRQYQRGLGVLRARRLARERQLTARAEAFWETVLSDDLVHLAPANLPDVLEHGIPYRRDSF